jgi:hypothetical protein
LKKPLLLLLLLLAPPVLAGPHIGIDIIPNPDPDSYAERFDLFAKQGEAAPWVQVGTVSTANATATILFTDMTVSPGLNIFGAKSWNSTMTEPSAMGPTTVACIITGTEGFCNASLPPGQLTPKKKN